MEARPRNSRSLLPAPPRPAPPRAGRSASQVKRRRDGRRVSGLELLKAGDRIIRGQGLDLHSALLKRFDHRGIGLEPAGVSTAHDQSLRELVEHVLEVL